MQAVAKVARVLIQIMAAAGTSRQCRTQDEQAHHEAVCIQLECKRQI